MECGACAVGMSDIAAKVAPSGMLTSDQVLQVFTYLGSNKKCSAASSPSARSLPVSLGTTLIPLLSSVC
jgi:hypothetical protein